MNSREHWDNAYSNKRDSEVSWTQADPRLSLSLVTEVCPKGSIIDVGGGNSVLVDRLLDAGYSVAVLDISEAALARARARLGPRGDQVRWIGADVTGSPELGHFDVWHDRAVFHFLTRPADRAAYVALLTRTIRSGGHAIIATFAPDGPTQCSGLDVCRYDGASLAAELGKILVLMKTVSESHLTPWGKAQSFQYSVFRRGEGRGA